MSAIQLENQKPGPPQSVWQIPPGADPQLIQGFTTSISTNVGGTVNFKINNQTRNANYSINIYRLGYYGGDGATLVTTLQHQPTSAVIQPAPLTDNSTGLVDAGNWSVTDSWTVPTTATSSVYIANVIDGSEVFQIPFVIRIDSSTSNIVFQTADETWQAGRPRRFGSRQTGENAGKFRAAGEGGSGALVPHSEAVSLTRTDTAREWAIIARYPQGTCHG